MPPQNLSNLYYGIKKRPDNVSVTDSPKLGSKEKQVDSSASSISLPLKEDDDQRSLERKLIEIKIELANARCEAEQKELFSRQVQDEVSELQKQLDKQLKKEKESADYLHEMTSERDQLTDELDRLNDEITYLKQESRRAEEERTEMMKSLNSSVGR